MRAGVVVLALAVSVDGVGWSIADRTVAIKAIVLGDWTAIGEIVAGELGC